MAPPRKAKPGGARAPRAATIAAAPRIEKAAAAPTCYRYVLSSGLFGLPAGAESVDWMVVNDSPYPQTFRVTVYKAGVGPKAPVAPGAIVVTLAASQVTHNANSVGGGQPFVSGFYYEPVFETNDLRLLPSVHVWQDQGNTVIAGTLISPGTFVQV